MIATLLVLSSLLSPSANKEAAAVSRGGTSDVLVITPQERSKDIKHVFEFAQKHKGAVNFTLVLTNGEKLSNITSVETTPGGTILIVQAATMKGQSYTIVPLENIKEFSAR